MTTLKPYKVETVSDPKQSIHVDVMFDRERRDFFAHYDLDNKVRAKTADECAELAKKMLQMAVGGYRWRRLIDVGVSGESEASPSNFPAMSASLGHPVTESMRGTCVIPGTIDPSALSKHSLAMLTQRFGRSRSFVSDVDDRAARDTCRSS